MEWLFEPEAWIALVTLTALEIVLGVDNIIFISILTEKLPPEQRGKGRTLGLVAAMGMRILLLLGIVLLIPTAKGTLRIEIVGSDISVSIDGQEVKITDTKELPLEAREHSLSIKVGGAEIDLGKDVWLTTDGRKVIIKLGNKELSGERFTIVKGKNPVLTISLVPSEPKDDSGHNSSNVQQGLFSKWTASDLESNRQVV